MYGEPHRIRESAERLERRAGQIRVRAAEVYALGRQTHWVSSAADRMRNRVRRQYESLLGVARLYEEAARAVREHAAQVQALLDLIEQAQRRVRALVAGAWDRIRTVWDVAGDTLAAVPGAVGGLLAGHDPEQEAFDRRIVAARLPPDGHRDWLDVSERWGPSG